LVPGADQHDLALTSMQNAHIGSAGPASGKKTQTKDANGVAQVRTARMLWATANSPRT